MTFFYFAWAWKRSSDLPADLTPARFKKSSTSVSNFLDPIWERQKDTGREQKDGTNERIAGGETAVSLSLSLCRGRSVCTMYHTLIPAPRNDMRGMTCENGRPPTRAPAGHRTTDELDGGREQQHEAVPDPVAEFQDQRETRSKIRAWKEHERWPDCSCYVAPSEISRT